MATLYRNFPGRLELVEELFRHTVDDMCRAAESVSGDTPGEAFFAWLMRFHAIGARKGPLASVLLSESARGTPILRASRSRTIAAGEPLFPRRATQRRSTRRRLSRTDPRRPRRARRHRQRPGLPRRP